MMRPEALGKSCLQNQAVRTVPRCVSQPYHDLEDFGQLTSPWSRSEVRLARVLDSFKRGGD